MEAEVVELETDSRRELAERIKTAREWGDLKENSEYHDAKQSLALLEAKIAGMRARLLDAEIVAAAKGVDRTEAQLPNVSVPGVVTVQPTAPSLTVTTPSLPPVQVTPPALTVPSTPVTPEVTVTLPKVQ